MSVSKSFGGSRRTWCTAAWLGAMALLPIAGHAQDSGRLLATSGVTQLEGSAGGGLVPWSLISGYGTRDSVGASAHYTLAYLPDFTLHTAGVSVGLYDRVEIFPWRLGGRH